MGVLIIPIATTAQRMSITPAVGELIYDTTMKLFFGGDGITVGGEPVGLDGPVASVNGATGIVVLDADDISDAATANKFVTAAEKTKLANTSGVNSGDQNISGIATNAADIAALVPVVAANTAKITNATHTGDVTGSGALTIANNAVTNGKAAQMATTTIKGRITAGTGDAEDLTATQARTVLNVADGATANLSNATLLDRANHTGTQLASTISDFDAATAATASVTANTTKVTNATHTGEVTGATVLTIADGAVVTARIADNAVTNVKIAGTGTCDSTTFYRGDGTFAIPPAALGITRSIITTSGNVTLAAAPLTDYIYLVDGLHTLTFPTAVGNTNRYTIKNNHTVDITVNTTLSQTIEGDLSISIPPENSVDVISNNSNWFII